jgi:hypothetical protein
MPVIWKFELKLQDAQDVQMPRCAKVLSVQKRGAGLCLWARVDPDMPKEIRSFAIIGTGHPYGSIGLEYLATVQDGDYGDVVWHVFERTSYHWATQDAIR